jgi:hypothetical protein
MNPLQKQASQEALPQIANQHQLTRQTTRR